MKDSEFIELLNLYLDHEISGADAARLETEVQANPARRKVYQQYCRMQKACRMLTAEFQPATAGTAVALDKKVVAFDPGIAEERNPLRRYYAVGALAAAACVALVFVGRNRPDSEAVNATGTPIVQAAPEPAVGAKSGGTVVRGGLVSVAGQRAQAGHAQATMVSDPLLLTGHRPGATAVSPAMQQANDQLAWIASLQIPPLPQRVPADELWFDVRPATLRPEGRALGGNHVPTEAPVEMSAFRIVK